MIIQRVALIFALSLASVAAQQIPGCQEPPPAGFRPFDDLNKKEPWLDVGGSFRLEAEATRLDDGSRAIIRVRPGPCTGRECEPARSSFEQDSFWITIDAEGREAARIHVWAPYGEIDVIPQDLVGGPGDELLIVRIRGRASPPLGNEVRIVQLEEREARELGRFQLGGNLVTHPVACARWRTSLVVNPDDPKPRAVTLRRVFYAMPCCRILDDSVAELKQLRRDERVQFQPALGRYERN